LRLESTPSTGYSWQVAEGADDVLRLVREPDFREQSGLLGAAGVEVLRFEAVAPGTSELRLVYVRAWEKDVQPEREFALTVVVK